VIEAYGQDDSDDIIALGRGDIDLLSPGAWTRVFDDVRPDVVVHLAWSASAAPNYRDHADNWRWAETTIEATALAVERGIRFLATGTSVDEVPSDDAYSRSKAAVRGALAKSIAAEEIAWLRPFYVFDEDTPSPAVLRAALAAKSVGQPVHLANPRARHDFVHSRDAGSAIRVIVRAGLTGVVDIGSGSLAEVAELVEAFGCRWVADGASSSSAASGAPADVTALCAAGWEPRHTEARLGRSA